MCVASLFLMKISSENKLEYFHALVTLHTAHVQVGYFSLILNNTHTSFDRDRGVTTGCSNVKCAK